MGLAEPHDPLAWNGDVLGQSGVFHDGSTWSDDKSSRVPDLEVGPALAQGVGVAGLDSELRKTTSYYGWGDSGASSAQSFTGEGYVETVIAENSTSRMLGLSDADTDAGYVSIDYGLSLGGDGYVYIYEAGASKGQYGTYKSGDTFRVERLPDGHIIYSKNGTVFYTSATQSMADLRVDASFATPGATLTEVVLSVGGATAKPVDWVNDVGVTQGRLAASVTTNFADVGGVGQVEAVFAAADGRLWVRKGLADGTFGDTLSQDVGFGSPFGNVLRKMTSYAGWGDSGASSAQHFTGDGYVETVIAENSSSRMLGLSAADADASYASIDYGVSLGGDGYVYVYEDGVARGQVRDLRIRRYVPGGTSVGRSRRLQQERHGLLHQRHADDGGPARRCRFRYPRRDTQGRGPVDRRRPGKCGGLGQRRGRCPRAIDARRDDAPG